MKKNGKKQFRRILSWVLAICVVALLAMMPMLASESAAAGQQAVLRSAQAERRDIDTKIIGGVNSPARLPSRWSSRRR